MRKQAGAWAALAQSGTTMAGLAVGILIIRQTGARDAALSGVSAARMVSATPLLISAELIKLIGAASFVVMSLSLWSGIRASRARIGKLAGFVTATLPFASAATGLIAIEVGDRAGAGYAAAFGLASLAASGAFALACISELEANRSVAVRLIGSAYAAGAIIAPVLPPLSHLAAVIGIVWWAGLYALMIRE